MKNIVVFDEYHELDLKPAELLQEYKKKAEADVQKLLIEKGALKEYPSPGSSSNKTREAFQKFGLTYRECEESHTLYVSPRPDDQTLNDYYKNASSRIFWRDQLSTATDQKRREKIVKPRRQWIIDSTEEHLPKAEHWLDINTAQSSYIEEMLAARFFVKKTLLDPFLSREQLKSDQSVQIIDQPWWDVDIKEEVDVISLFEVIDRTADVHALFGKIHEMLKPGGLVFITATLASGFDIQVLWEHAQNIYPPDRLNVFSIEGFAHVFKKFSFECLEFSTPGILDLEIVAKALKENPHLEVPRFTKYLVENRDEDMKASFQEFLQQSLLSSYGRIVLRKKS